jgi:hypothetical protein
VEVEELESMKGESVREKEIGKLGMTSVVGGVSRKLMIRKSVDRQALKEKMKSIRNLVRIYKKLRDEVVGRSFILLSILFGCSHTRGNFFYNRNEEKNVEEKREKFGQVGHITFVAYGINQIENLFKWMRAGRHSSKRRVTNCPLEFGSQRVTS